MTDLFGHQASPIPRKPRRVDPLWETMIDVLGLRGCQLTKSERGRINKALSELREIGATPDQIEHRARVFREQYPELDITANAIVCNWARLGKFESQRDVIARVLRESA